MLADLQTIESDLGDQEMTWKGEDYVCMPSSNNTQATLEEGGFSVAVDLIINVRTDLFTDDVYPARKESLTFNNKTYRIAKVTEEPIGGFIQLMLVDMNKGV
jgi:hypothetical protein